MFRRRWKTFLAVTLLVIESVVAILLVSFTVIFWRFTQQLPSIESMANGIDLNDPVATTIWSHDGVKLGTLRVENRKPLKDISQIPKYVKEATLAIEDHRFYQHPGIDLKGTMRAVWANLSTGTRGQGGSTLTQQLIRNVKQFGVGKEKKVERKIREAFIAIRLEQLYSKDDLLLLYLNNIYYGRGAYGIEAAAQTFFGTTVSKLTLNQAALLAGMAQRPSDYSRSSQRQVAIERRNEVLNKMLEYGYINDWAFNKAKNDPVKILPRQPQSNFDFKAPHFVTYVLRQLFNKYGTDFVYSGLKIETTLNWKMQEWAQQTLRSGLDRGSSSGANQGALISLDNKTGYIRAMVGGRNFYVDQFNAVTQGRRQPGSTFKIFDYSAAFDKEEATLYSTFRDEPIAYPNDPTKVVKNYSGGYSYGSVSCLTGIQFSKNTTAVKVAQKVGMKTVIAYAKKMGITTKIANVLPSALGASAVRPLDLASAYSVFPNQGKRALPMSIARVLDANGDVLWDNQPLITEGILKQSTVEQMDKALSAVVSGGTGTRANGVEGARGKTGTTNDNRDAWFAGYTPELTTVIWVASVHKTKGGRVEYHVMPGATGGQLCAPMWKEFMLQAIAEQKLHPINIPGVTVTEEQVAQKTVETQDVERPRQRRRQARPAEEQNAAQPPAEPEPDEDPTTMDNSKAGETGASRDAEENPGNRDSNESDTTSPEPETQPEREPVTANAPRRTTRRSEEPARPVKPLTVSARVCTNSGQIATRYCPETRSKKITADQKQGMSSCSLHRVPPGEEE
jgi:penicillin-binding protein 1A